MKKTEEQLAQELDAFLTARLQKRPAPPLSPEIAAAGEVADGLLLTAARSPADPVFLSSLEARLHAAASGPQSESKPERPSVRQNMIHSLQEGFTMKRLTFALGAIMALLIIGYAAWFAWADAREPQIVAEEPALRPLPGLSSAGDMAAGRGAGGDGVDVMSEVAGEAGILPMPDMWWDPLAEAEYQLATGLPPSPADVPVYEQSGGYHFTQEDARRFAALFGFGGGAYQEQYTFEDPAWTPPPVYHFFDGTRQLTVTDAHLYYFDHGLVSYFEAGPDLLPNAEAVAIAERFLREKGLLDFSYEAVSFYGNEVEFRRVLDGRTVLLPEFQVSVHNSGHVWAVSHTPLSGLAAVGNYPIRTAEEAWQTVVNEGIDYRRSFFSLYPDPDHAVPEPPPSRGEAEETYRYWERTYRDGETVTLYSYAMVFVPLAESDTPRVQVDRYLLEGPATELWAMARETQRPWYLEAIYRERPDGARLELVTWRPATEPEYAYHEGTVRREGGRTLLLSDEGERLLLPNAPADLPEGARVYVHGWPGGEGDGNGLFNWSGMGLLVKEEAIWLDPLPGDAFEPTSIRRVTIHEITMLYSVAPIFENFHEPPRHVVQPVWRFKGETDTNEIIEIYVQAVTDEFIQENGR
jgi:hypothetical protein